MKQVKIAGTLAAICLLATAASAEVLTIKLTAVQQATLGEEVSPNVYKSTVTKIRITTGDILGVIASYYLTNFPAGAMLNAVDGNAQVLSADGVVLLDVAPSVFEAMGGDVEVYSAVEKDTATGNYSAKGSSIGHLLLNTGETNYFSLYVDGLVSYQYKESFRDGNYTSTFKMPVAGQGYWTGISSIVSGTISGKGSGVVSETTSAGTATQNGADLVNTISPITTIDSGALSGSVDSSAGFSSASQIQLEDSMFDAAIIQELRLPPTGLVDSRLLDSSRLSSVIQSWSDRDAAAADAFLRRIEAIQAAENGRAIFFDPLP